jgi:hypothetical protein
VKLLRTIQLDASDSFVYEKAAEPGEWAVSGAFVFAQDDPANLRGKARRAFEQASWDWPRSIENVRGEPSYLLLAMNADGVLRLKPQNLIAGLPICQAEAVN